MQARYTPRAVWSHLRATYWFLPSVLTAAAIALAFSLMFLDRVTGRDGLPGWLAGGGPDGARSLLSAVAGSIITVVSVTFSVTIVALTVSAQHFGPRLLNSFMRDRSAQVVLGIFIGTFAYCLIVLRHVQGDGDEYDRFVPHLSISAALALTLVSVGALIFYVHHVAVALQVSHIVQGVTRDLRRAIDRLYPEQLGAGEPARPDVPVPPVNAVRIPFSSSGYVQQLEAEQVLDVARDHEVVIWLQVRPGDFATEGLPLALVAPAPEDLDGFTRALNGTLLLGADRTETQDPAFPVQQLVEVTLHALSTGINEPFTAATCIDRLGEGLARMATRHIPSPIRADRDGTPRVIAPRETFGDLLDDAFDPIRAHAGRSPGVGRQLLEVLGRLAQVSRRPEDRVAIERQADRVLESLEAWHRDPSYGPQLREAHARVARALASPPV